MDISWWRDLVIVIWGLVASIAVIVISVLIILSYRKLSTLMKSADTMVAKANDVLDYTKEEILQPAVQLERLIQGIIKGFSLISNLFKKKEDSDD